MKLGITGLPQSGKSTIFAALTGARGEDDEAGPFHKDTRIATVRVPDERIDFLANMYNPKKIAYAKVEYLLPSSNVPEASGSKSEGGIFNQVRSCDAILHIVRNFKNAGGQSPSAEHDFWQIEEDFILNDLAVVEKRVERIALDRKRGKKPQDNEYALLMSCAERLGKGLPLRNDFKLSAEPVLKGFTFLSARPMLVIVNNEEDDNLLPQWIRTPDNVEVVLVRGRLEKDIALMDKDDAREFFEIYDIKEFALDRLIKSSYRLLKLVSFFTVGSDEVKAWPIVDGTIALDAAGTVHSDIKQGFIRAEVVSFDDLKTCGSFQEAKKKGAVRLEGKEYVMKDGDIVNFRFNI
jgi:GTP-binding protein YchF